MIFLIILLILGGLSFVFVPKILNGEPLIPTEQSADAQKSIKLQNSESESTKTQNASPKNSELSEKEKEALEIKKEFHRQHEKWQKLYARI